MPLTLEDAMEALGLEPDQLSDYKVEADRILMKLVRRPREVISWRPDTEPEYLPSLSNTIAKGEELLKVASPEVIAFADSPGEDRPSVDLAYVEYTGKTLTKADVVAHIKARAKRRKAKRAVVKV